MTASTGYQLGMASAESLDSWLASAIPIGLLVGPSGSGKSHLLHEWSARLEGAGEWNVVMLAISRRDGTWLARDFVPRLRDLLSASGLDLSTPPQCNWRQLMHSLVYELGEASLNLGRQTLIIIDGLFETPSSMPTDVELSDLTPQVKLLFSCPKSRSFCAMGRQPVGELAMPIPTAVEVEGALLSKGLPQAWAPELLRLAAGSRAGLHILLEALGRGMLNELSSFHLWTDTLQWLLGSASKNTQEVLSLLSNSLAPLSDVDLCELLNEDHLRSIERDPLVALLTHTSPKGLVLRHETLDPIIARGFGSEWGAAGLKARCSPQGMHKHGSYTLRFGAYHCLPASSLDATVVFLSEARQKQWQQSVAPWWAWSDELRLVVDDFAGNLLHSDARLVETISGVYQGTLQCLSLYEYCESVGDTHAWPNPGPTIDDTDALGLSFAKMSRFVSGEPRHHLAAEALALTHGDPLAAAEVALHLPPDAWDGSFGEILRRLRDSQGSSERSVQVTDVALRIAARLPEEESIDASDIVEWIYGLVSGQTRSALAKVDSLSSHLRRALWRRAQRDETHPSELRAALLSGLDEPDAALAAATYFDGKAWSTELSLRAKAAVIRHLSKDAVACIQGQEAGTPLVKNIAARYAMLGEWDAACRVLDAASDRREGVVAEIACNAAPGEPRCLGLLQLLKPDELERLVGGETGARLMNRHGVGVVFDWASTLGLKSGGQASLVRNAATRPPQHVIDQLKAGLEGNNNASQLWTYLALGRSWRAPDAPAWVVSALNAEEARRCLARLSEGFIEKTARRFVLDDDPHPDLMALMPLIHHVGGNGTVVELGRVLKDVWQQFP